MVSRLVFCAVAISVLAASDQWTPPVRVVVAETGTGHAVTAKAARPTIPDRGIATNEAAAVDICQKYVDAQFSYFRLRYAGSLSFAQRIRSSEGKLDGLYWPREATEDESPMGPRFAAAAAAELAPGAAQPWLGYYFKILIAQGPQASGGSRDYRVDGRLTSGFALIAWPAEYGVSGVRSFVVNHLGDVYAKDLGANTPRTAMGTAAFSPDRTWKRVVTEAESR
jgi:DUF2950 family protein